MERPTGGHIESTYTDEDLVAEFARDPSAKHLAEHFGVTKSSINKRLARIRKRGRVEMEANAEREGKLRQLLASVPVDGPMGSTIASIEAKQWGVAAKNDEGEIVTRGLDGLTLKYKVKPDAAVWPPITPMYSIDTFVYKALPDPVETEFERVFVWGDMQAHFWREKGGLVPFHDEAAIDVGLQALARYKPHRVVILGDFLDLPGLGRFRKEPAFAGLMNAAIAYGTNIIRQIRAIVGPECIIDFVPGNHEARLIIAILENLGELYGIKRPGDTFSLLSIPYLLQFEKYDVRCAEQYPGGEVWLTDDLVCLHGPDAGLAATQICGHRVRATVDSKTRHYRDGRQTDRTIIVPGFGDYHRRTNDQDRIQRTNIPSGVARSNAEQAFATVDIHRESQRFSVKVWEIENGSAFFREHGLLQGVAAGWTYDEAA